MSHQVLARKWRPRTFDTLVGQEHVVRALTHALETGRLHHAYLFTGTRGVGKTTIARILAKAVNCEQGITATPCGQCSACTRIDQGGFVDYLELDAASNRGVDEMVQILDNAVYAPTAGRYKVYVIDEVHMLTMHAFNAMLKTLEEPPPHVLFILATTDPQKVPVTVLSRCMQFNLRNMQPQAIAGHLADVLSSESLEFEPGALDLIGRAAAGSMRDALSLTDQAIAAGAGSVKDEQVRDMLGMIDARYVEQVLQALASSDGAALVALADNLAETPEACVRLLSDLASELADMAARQQAAAAQPAQAALPDFPAATIQVFYQVAIYGQRDLPLAPDPRAGLLMALLRMLAFAGLPDEPAASPAGDSGAAVPAGRGGAAAARAALSGGQQRAAKTESPVSSAPPATGGSVKAAAAPTADKATAEPGRRAARARPSSVMERLIAGEHPASRQLSSPDQQADPVADIGGEGVANDLPDLAGGDSGIRVNAHGRTLNGGAKDARRPQNPGNDRAGGHESAPPGNSSGLAFDGNWPALARRVGLTGRPGQFLLQSQLERVQGDKLHVRVPVEQLAEPGLVKRVTDALQAHLPGARLLVTVGRIDGETGAVKVAEEREQRLQAARESLEADPFVKSLLSDFDAIIVPESVRPIDNESVNGRKSS